jgi:hydroxyethylthiazole kinase-like sugar kinase family protein
MMMKISGSNARMKVAGVGCLLGGLAAAIMSAPSATAAPARCDASGVASSWPADI